MSPNREPSHREHLLSSSYNSGCYYGAGGFSPYSYYYTSPNAYRVEVRLNTDPVVAASDSTYGCSDSSYSNSQYVVDLCFKLF